MLTLLSIVVSIAQAAVLSPRDARATSFCARLSTDAAKERCLVETGKKPGKHYDAVALKACESFGDDTSRVRCLVITREARSFEPAAVELCSALGTSGERLQCLGAIAGAWFRPSALRQCRSGGLEQAIPCLAAIRE